MARIRSTICFTHTLVPHIFAGLHDATLCGAIPKHTMLYDAMFYSYTYIYVDMFIYIYIYIERERERDHTMHYRNAHHN